MTVAASPAPFPFEAALKDSLEIFRKNAAVFIIVLLIGGAPSFLGQLLLVLGGLSMVTFTFLLSIVGGLTALIATATVQTAVLNGNADVNGALSRVTPRLLPLLGVAILVGLVVMIGLILLIVPGVIAACALLIAVPLFLDQNTGVIDSLQRSFEMTKGNWLKIFLMLLIFGIVGGIASFIISFILSMILGGFGAALAGWVMNAIIGAFGAVLIVVTYRKLRGGVYA